MAPPGDDSFDETPPSPSPTPRGPMSASSASGGGGMGSNVAFKPPPRPGSSLRKGRKSSNIGLGAENGTLAPPMPRTNSNVSASSSDAGLGFQSAVDQPEPASSSSRPESPVSSVGTPGDLGYPYEGAPSSEAAQALAATTQCRQRLQILRDENDNQTHAAGLLGAGLLEQRNKIEALMDELAEELQSESAQQDGVFEGQGQGQSDEGASKRDRIRQLQEKLDAEVEEMDRQRVELYKEVLAAGGSSVPIARVSDSPSKSFSALPFLTKDPNFFGTPTRAGNTSIGSNGSAAGPTPKQTDRRARNAAARQSIGDQNLVNQLQDNLVNEIRRLQGLLAERDAEIALLRTAKEDADKDVALWKPKALQLIETEDALKQENWDLSVARQNLEEQLSDSFASFKKAEGEKARLTKDLSKARETIDGQRVQIDAHLAELEELRTLRETETAMARRDKAGMQRDFSDLQTELQQFKLQQLGKLSLNRSLSSSMLSGNSSLDEDANKDEDQGPDSLAARRKAALAAELPPSPSGSTYSEDASISAGSPLSGRLVRDQEMRDLRAKLTMAQKKAGKEAAEKRRQREQNAELRRLLAQAGVDAPVIADVESSDDDGDDDDEHWIDEPNTSPSAKRLAKMRMPKSSTRPSMASRMGLSPRAAGAAAGAELDEDDAPEEFEDASADADTIAAGSEEHTSIDDRSSPRNSLDGGIDPAFADVMKADFATPARERKGRKAAVRNQKTVAAGSPLARGSFGPEEGETDSGEESPPERRPEQRPSGRRSAAAAARPQSTIIEPTALGAELEGLSGPDEEELHSQGLHTAEDGFEPSMQTVRPETADADMQTEPEPEPVPAVVEPAREMTETVMMTEPEPDVLSPALAERDNAHAVALSEVHKRHADALADKEREHQAMLAEKESAHSTALAAALADKAKTHEAALGEARSRHTRALAEQVAQGSAALVAAEAAHKALLAERHSAYETDVALRDAVHGSALAQKDQEHSKALQHMEATHAAFVAQRDQAYQAALAEKDVALRNSQAEVDQLRRQLDELRSLLEASKQDLATSKAAHDASVQQLASAQAEAERAAAAAKEQSTAMAQAQAQAQAQAEQQKESQKVAHVDSAVQAGSGTESAVKAPALGAGAALAGAAGAAVLTKDGNSTAHAESDVDRFEDAVSHMSPTASSFAMTPSVTQSTLANRTAQPEESDEEDGDDTQSVIASRVNDARRRASSTSSSDNSPKTPKDEIAQPGIRKVVLADLKDMSCQTDDELWLSHQAAAAQQAAIGREQAQPPRPLSSLTVSTRDGTAPTDSMVGPGGIMILGGHRSSRPRDSVSTFGGNREGSLRNESPAPTMYTVGAVTGQGHNPSRRPSVESTWSHHADRNAEVPPVPPLPDKTKPPTMAVPPPPSMPPPPGLPVKRSQPPQTLQIPPRPTSPPPADLVHRAQRSTLLQVPANGGERSVSRQSGGSVAPPSSFVPSAASGSVRQHGSLNSMRTRTLSSEGASGVSQFGGLAPPAGDGYAASAGAGTGRQSISSRRSAKGKQRQSSAASFASDVTSELSRRLSIASSRASDILADRTSAENNAGTRGPATRGAGVMGASESTDPSVIHAITQTMIGEYLYKYTRRTMGRAGHSDKRHRRYFWVHPYTKMLYWTMSDPGGAAVTEGTSKSACIEDVRVVEDSNPNPPGLYHLSILVKTAAREMKVTAPNKDRHDTWLSALGYLVNRSQPANPAANGAAGAGAAGTTDQENGATARKPRNRSKTTGTVKSRLLSPARSLRSRRSVESFGAGIDSTPRPRGASVGGASTLYASVNKRRDIPAREYLAQQEQEELLRSPTGSTRMRGGSNAGGGGGGNDVFTSQLDADDSYDGLGDISGMSFADPRLKTAEEMLEEDEEEGFEGLDNVRACCDGKHDVGSLAHRHHHHHHGHSHGSGTASRRHQRMGSGSSASRSYQLRSHLHAAVDAATASGGAGAGAGSATGSERATSPPPQLPLNLPRDGSEHGYKGSDGTFSSSIFDSASEGFGMSSGGGGGASNINTNAHTNSNTNKPLPFVAPPVPGSTAASNTGMGMGMGTSMGMPAASHGSSTGSGSSPAVSSSGHVPYSERLGQIRKARQSGGGAGGAGARSSSPTRRQF